MTANRLPEPAYVAGLATELRATQDELAQNRQLRYLVAAWINNPAHDRDARINLAQHLGLPAPRTADPKDTA